MRFKPKQCLLVLFLLVGTAGTNVCLAQRGVPAGRSTGFTLFGDVEVTGETASNSKALFDLLLYSRSGVLLDRQKVGSKGRYRFLNVPAGDYDLVIEFENAEVARSQVRLVGVPTDFRQDLALEWRPGPFAGKSNKPEVLSAEDVYNRNAPNQDRFEKARAAFDKKDYDVAIALLRQMVAEDRSDFQAWSELGTAYLVQNNLTEAERAYLTATEIRPTYFRALLNLGRVRLLKKDFEGALAVLTQAVSAKPTSADANYYIGEAYLQLKKGSKAVPYLYEALRLEPIKMADAHLRLAALYNAAGVKDKAAAEYEEFLKKRPDYPDRKKLEKYIAENKKP